MAYSDKVLDHYENPRNVGTFEDGDQVGTGMVGAPACGDPAASAWFVGCRWRAHQTGCGAVAPGRVAAAAAAADRWAGRLAPKSRWRRA